MICIAQRIQIDTPQTSIQHHQTADPPSVVLTESDNINNRTDKDKDAESAMDCIFRVFRYILYKAQAAAESLIMVMDDMGLLKVTPEVDTSGIDELDQATEGQGMDLSAVRDLA